MKVYKGHEKNTTHLEGCIAEHYSVEESILYFIKDVPDGDKGRYKRTRQRFLDDDGACDEEPLDKGKVVHLTNIQHQQVRRWVCYNGIAVWEE